MTPALAKRGLTRHTETGGVPHTRRSHNDKASVRLRKKYIRISNRSNGNIAKVAVARELACFVWGMMTGKIC